MLQFRVWGSQTGSARAEAEELCQLVSWWKGPDGIVMRLIGLLCIKYNEYCSVMSMLQHVVMLSVGFIHALPMRRPMNHYNFTCLFTARRMPQYGNAEKCQHKQQ